MTQKFKINKIFNILSRYSKTKISLETEDYKNNILIKIKNQVPRIYQEIKDKVKF